MLKSTQCFTQFSCPQWRLVSVSPVACRHSASCRRVAFGASANYKSDDRAAAASTGSLWAGCDRLSSPNHTDFWHCGGISQKRAATNTITYTIVAESVAGKLEASQSLRLTDTAEAEPPVPWRGAKCLLNVSQWSFFLYLRSVKLFQVVYLRLHGVIIKGDSHPGPFINHITVTWYQSVRDIAENRRPPYGYSVTSTVLRMVEAGSGPAVRSSSVWLKPAPVRLLHPHAVGQSVMELVRSLSWDGCSAVGRSCVKVEVAVLGFPS